MKVVRIIGPNPDSLSSGIGTRLLMDDGSEIPAVESVVIRMDPNKVVTAEVRIAVAFTDISAHALLDIDTVRQSAKAHGFDLVPATADLMSEGRSLTLKSRETP